MRWIIIFVLIIALAGCSLKISPEMANHSQEIVLLSEGDGVARTGQLMLAVYDRYEFPAYAPKSGMDATIPDNAVLPDMDPAQVWVQYHRLDDGTLIVDAPAHYYEISGQRLGLTITPDGNVTGDRPWVDLDAGTKVAQPDWGTASREVFRNITPYAVDVFEFDAIYAGMDENVPGVEVRRFKHGQPVPWEMEYHEVPEGQQGILDLGKIMVRVLETTPEFIRYEIMQ